MTLHITTRQAEDMLTILKANPAAMLHYHHARQYLAKSRWEKAGPLQTHAAPTTGVTPGAIAHNRRETEDNAFGSATRSQRLLGPLSGLDPVYTNAGKLRVLSIGPRTEMELFHLLALGFELPNISALDLVSSSPFIQLGDMHAMPYPDESFDVVISSWVLNYSSEPGRAVAEMARVAKPGALVAIGLTYAPDAADPNNMLGSMTATYGQLLDMLGPRAGRVCFMEQAAPGTQGPVMLIVRLKGTPPPTAPTAPEERAALSLDVLANALKGGLGKRARDELGRVEAALVAKSCGIATPSGSPAITEPLNRDGFVMVGPWPNVAAAFRTALEPLPTVHTDGRFNHYITKDLLAVPDIARFVTDPRLIDWVSGYLGAPATISIVTAWWSHPVAAEPVGMQLWHHDRADFRSCNLFLYLTDVDADSGPHCYVAGTHESNPHERHTAREAWFDQSNRKTDADVLLYYGDHHTFLGPAGTAWLGDTRGLHKGVVPRTRSRLMFEIVYTLMPKGNEKYAPVPCPVAITEPLVKYATRLMYRSTP